MSVSIGTVVPLPPCPPRARLIRAAGALATTLLATALLSAVTGLAYQTAAGWRDQRRFPPLGRMVDVGGVRLHIVCIGQGSPVVVLDGPIGSSWLGWHRVQPAIARTTRVCAYDRAGYGWSDPGIAPRDSGQIAEELYTLLQQARVGPPYVLVGASFGGLNVRLFAARHAKEVAGMVLVDAVHEDQVASPGAAGVPSSGDLLALDLLRLSAHVGVMRLLDSPMGEASAGTLPPPLRPMARAAGFRSSWFDAVFRETAALGQSMAMVRAIIPRDAPLMGDRPLIVVSHDRDRGVDSTRAGLATGEARAATQHRLADDSTNSRHVVVHDDGRPLQAGQPVAVVQAIERVVGAARAAARH